METNSERPSGHLTLARVHAALGGISVVMIGAIISANNMSYSLRVATWWFGASILLNTFFFVMEVDPLSPRYESRWIQHLFSWLFNVAIVAPLNGMSCVIIHVSPTAGILFTVVGLLMLSFHFFVNQRAYRRLHRLRTYGREVSEYARLSGEYNRKFEEFKRVAKEYEQLSHELRASSEKLTHESNAENSTGAQTEEREGKLQEQIRRREDLLRQHEELERLDEEFNSRLAELKSFPTELARTLAKVDQLRAEIARLRREASEWEPKVIKPREKEVAPPPVPPPSGASGGAAA